MSRQSKQSERMLGFQGQNCKVQVRDELFNVFPLERSQALVCLERNFVEGNGTDQENRFRVLEQALNLRGKRSLGTVGGHLERRRIEKKSQLIASFKKCIDLFIRHRPRQLVKLLRRHLQDVFQRPELPNLFRGRLDNLGDRPAMPFNHHPLALLNCCQELSQLVLRFGHAHRHTCILAIL